MQETLTLAQLHALLAAVPATAQVRVDVDGLTFEMFDLEIRDGRAVLAVDSRPALWEFTAEDFTELLHNEFYTTPAVMPVFVRDLQGRELPVGETLCAVPEGVAVQAGGQPIEAPAKVAALYRAARTRQRIAQR
ncbi:hypothetical protein D3875_04345 [Deinococcus cavernae]|uniref:Uncharacterized protein n=1 Tax=Deinococcus cavernae TaxID=2320857 RepID=A0A418VEI2_9DEIO|nr:hypothetical protein [Deinococcus cavernae]RJF74516.1 hypothetical protein D3875_04345 [Deinococcus cavernae]